MPLAISEKIKEAILHSNNVKDPKKEPKKSMYKNF